MEERDRLDWTDQTAAERVRMVALAVSEPRTANWIATEADVAHDTARKYLEQLADDGKLTTDTTGQQTVYAPDPIEQYLTEMRELYETHSADELAASLEQIGAQIREWKSEYDVETPNELRASISDVEPETASDRRRIAGEWERLEFRRGLVEDTLRLYDRFPGGGRAALA